MRDEVKEIMKILHNIGFSTEEIKEYIKTIRKEARLNPLFVRD